MMKVEKGRLTPADDLTVRGRFEWDEEKDGELPLLVINGKAVIFFKIFPYKGSQKYLLKVFIDISSISLCGASIKVFNH